MESYTTTATMFTKQATRKRGDKGPTELGVNGARPTTMFTKQATRK